MRVAMALHSMLLGGSQINTVDLATELRRRGHDVLLFALDAVPRESSIQPVADAADIAIEQLDPRGGLIAQARTVRRLVQRHDSDVLHVFHEDGHLGPLGSLALLTRRKSALVVTNWMMSNSYWVPRHAPLVVGYPDLQREARRHQRGPVHVLEPPVNTERDHPDERRASEFRSEHGIGPDEILLVVVSRVDVEMKLSGILCAIDAVGALADRRVRLAIVGSGDAIRTVADAAAAVNTQLGRDAVLLTGALTDPRPAYSAADVVLGMGGSALRALAFGKPLVVLGEGGFSRIFNEDTADQFFQRGFFGEAESNGATSLLASTLRSLLCEEQRAQLGEYGMAVIHERFSLDVQTTKLEAIYEHAVARRSGLPARLSDVGYVTTYHAAHRFVPAKLKAAVRRRVTMFSRFAGA